MDFEFACDVVKNDPYYFHLETTSCHGDQFQCNNKRCIEDYEVCNWVSDCGDNSDETHCGMFD